jgi:trans-2,3-dihydro-3-hydroxyanthranilate isomerase
MVNYRYYTLDVFTDQRFGGNQLAVLPAAEGLSSEQMQQIAREFNFSETVFVLPPENPANTCRVRIFTPGSELAFAGHPTVGAGFLLAVTGAVPPEADGAEMVLEELVGLVPVKVLMDGGRPCGARLTTARLPEAGPPPPPAEQLAAMLSLEPDDIMTGDYAPEAFSCGTPFLFVNVRDRAALARARIRPDLWDELLAAYVTQEPYVFCFDPELPGSHLRARLFAPGLGIGEDPATGSAVAALAGYLGARQPQANGTRRWVVEQGFEMGRPSILGMETDWQDGRITAVRVGGACVLVSEGNLFL